MQVIGRPVGRDVCAVPPDGAYLLTAQRLPDSLTLLYVVVVEEQAPVRSHDLLWDRRRVANHLNPYASEDCE